MSDIARLKVKLQYHEQQVLKFKTAIEVLESIAGETLEITTAVATTITTKTTPTPYNLGIVEVPKTFDPQWTHIQKVAYFFNQIGRCAFPFELAKQYKLHNIEVKDSMVNQVLNMMKVKKLVKSYKSPYDSKAHAWGLSEWFENDKVLNKYEALKPEKTLWD